MNRPADSTGSEPSVLIQVHEVEGGSIFEIVINRPDVHNAVNGEAAALLLAAWRRFRDDDALTVPRGEQGTTHFARVPTWRLETLAPPTATTADIEAMVRQGTGPMGGSRIIQTKPVITVTQGHTYAGGLELYCHGHIRIAEPQAQFSVACRRWGVPLVDGGTVYLPRLLGWSGALPLIITGQRITAERAYQLGLVWELVAKGQGLEGPCPWLDKSASNRAKRCSPTWLRRSAARICRSKRR